VAKPDNPVILKMNQQKMVSGIELIKIIIEDLSSEYR